MAVSAACAADIKVWYPLGYGKVDGGGHRYFAVQTDSYKFVYDLGRPGITELYNLARNPAGGSNLLMTSDGPGGYVALTDGALKRYTSYLSNGNALVTVVKGPNSFPNMYQTRMSFRQAGRVYYQIDVTGIKLASADGATAPLTVKQRFHLWPEKFYIETSFSVSADVTVRFAEFVTSYDPARFTHLSSAALGNVALTPGFIHYLAPMDPYLGLYDAAGTNGSLAQIYVNRDGTDTAVFYYGAYGSASAALHLIQRAYDYDLRGGSTTWRAGEYA